MGRGRNPALGAVQIRKPRCRGRHFDFKGALPKGLSSLKLRRRLINRPLPKVSSINHRMA
jgi:hypothetical protein